MPEPLAVGLLIIAFVWGADISRRLVRKPRPRFKVTIEAEPDNVAEERYGWDLYEWTLGAWHDAWGNPREGWNYVNGGWCSTRDDAVVAAAEVKARIVYRETVIEESHEEIYLDE
jgi:hypothetical protein